MAGLILCNRTLFLKCLRNTILFEIRKYSHELNVNETKPTKAVRNALSTLYVPGRRGKDIYQIVKPLIDVEFISENMECITRSCKLRGLTSKPDLDQLVPNLKIWENLKNEYKNLIEKKQEYLEKLKTISPHDEGFEELNKEHDEFVLTLKHTKNQIHDIEDLILPEVQEIPNFLDPETPEKEDTILKQDSIDQEHLCESHTEIGRKMGLLSFSETSPTAYYLLGEWSELEHAANNYFAEQLMSLGYTQLACPDFCKSFVCEATGSDPIYDNISLQLPRGKDREYAQRSILVGSSSFESFCSYFINMNVSESNLPLQYFSQGRCYNAQHGNVQSPDLFNVIQSPSVHCLTMCKGHNATQEFDNMFNNITSCYQSFKIPSRLVEVSPKNLNPSESRRRRLELWSPWKKCFIPVAHVSQRGDFISKRLHMTFGIDYHVNGFCFVVEGAAVHLPVLVGCILENYPSFSFKKSVEFLHEYL